MKEEEGGSWINSILKELLRVKQETEEEMKVRMMMMMMIMLKS